MLDSFYYLNIQKVARDGIVEHIAVDKAKVEKTGGSTILSKL